MFEEVRIRERKSVKHGTTYEYRFEVARVDGERKWLSKGGFQSMEQAKAAGIEARKKYCLCGLSERPSDISYADFLDEWMENDCKFNLKETTLLNYRKRIKNHIKPELGSYQVMRLNRDRLQKFLNMKHDEGYSKNTLSTLRGIISKSLTYAVDCGIIATSPAHNLRIPRCEMTTVPTRSDPHSYLPTESMQKIFDRFPEGSSAYIPIMIGYRCGLRIGEVYALTWSDIDLTHRKLTVSRQIQWKSLPRSDEEKQRTNGSRYATAGFWYFSTPKFGSSRTIDMDSSLTDLLLRERNRQMRAAGYFETRFRRYYEDSSKRITEDPSGKEVDFVCRRENGEYINLRTMQHATTIIHEQLHLPEFDFHSLRHTHATMLVENGAPLKYVQRRPGHKKIDVTMNIYQHLTDALREQGNAVIETMYRC
jgi:integrase